MNYRHIYMCIIARAKSEEKQGIRRKGNGTYYESHHILPRSLFPAWDKEKRNRALLTAKEHYFVHHILIKIYPGSEMANAFYRMSHISRYNKYFNISMREFQKIREDSYVFSKGNIPWNKGVTGYHVNNTSYTPERRQQMSQLLSELNKQRYKENPRWNVECRKYVKGSQHPSSKPVINLKTLEVFGSCREAKEKYPNVSPERVARGEVSQDKGTLWAFYDSSKPKEYYIELYKEKKEIAIKNMQICHKLTYIVNL